jgi:hypothetical protein
MIAKREAYLKQCNKTLVPEAAHEWVLLVTTTTPARVRLLQFSLQECSKEVREI